MEKPGDILGYPLNEGDRVVMASGGQQDDGLYIGTITEIGNNRYGRIEVKVKKDGGSINRRRPEDLMSLMAINEMMPEIFI